MDFIIYTIEKYRLSLCIIQNLTLEAINISYLIIRFAMIHDKILFSARI